MANPGRPKKIQDTIANRESSVILNEGIGINTIPNTSKDASQKYTEDRNEIVSRHNDTLSKVQLNQELPPAKTTSSRPVARKLYQPQDMLTVTGKKANRFYIWIRNKAEEIESMKAQFHGAVVDTDQDVAPGFTQRLDATKTVSNAKIIGDLILMSMPIETYHEYEEYWKEQNVNPGAVPKSVLQNNNNMSESGSGLYGESSSTIIREKF